MNSHVTYLEFLLAAERVRNVDLDPLEERLLCTLAARGLAGVGITVMQAMKLNIGVSGTTTFRRIKSLRAKGMIDLVVDAVDMRVKHIWPTEKALQLFEKLRTVMLEVSAQNCRVAAPTKVKRSLVGTGAKAEPILA